MRVLITGAAGFIGYHVAKELLARGAHVIGIDNLNDYYDPTLKRLRVEALARSSAFELIVADVAQREALHRILGTGGDWRVIHLAAQAGVRHSIERPFAFERTNVRGHIAVLEACCRCAGVQHLVYASSSSVYGNRDAVCREDDPAVEPVSLYAATKRACELISHAYGAVHGLRQTGLRFFTAYGALGRPDMAYFKFSESIMRGLPIEVYGHGELRRDFTHISDVVDGVVRVLDFPPAEGENRLLNVGSGRPVGLLHMISLLEQYLGRTAKKKLTGMQPGDVKSTRADIGRIAALVGYQPRVSIETGLQDFVKWFLSYRGRPSQ